MGRLVTLDVCPNYSTWSIESSAFNTESMFTGKRRTFALYERWKVTLEFNGLNIVDGRKLQSWVAALANRVNYTELTPTPYDEPADAAANGTISGAGAEPTFTGSNVTAGDYAQAGNQLLQIASVSPFIISPSLRLTAVNVPLVFSSPSGRFVLDSDPVLNYSPGEFTNVSVTLVELI